MGVENKRVYLLRCPDVPIIMKSVLFALNLRVLYLIQPDISPIQSPCWVREQYVSAVDKGMYTWVSAAYKWSSNLWLQMRDLRAASYRVNSSCPRIELSLWRVCQSFCMWTIIWNTWYHLWSHTQTSKYKLT